MERHQWVPALASKGTHRAGLWRIRWAMAAAGLIAAMACAAPGGIASGANTVARVGSPAPNFTLQLLDGKKITLASLKGKVVVLNFWHSG